MSHPQIDAVKHFGVDKRDQAEKSADIDPKCSSTSDIQYSLDARLSDGREPVRIDLVSLRAMVIVMAEAIFKLNVDIDADGNYFNKPVVAGIDGEVNTCGVVPEKLNTVVYTRNRDMLMEMGAEMYYDPAGMTPGVRPRTNFGAIAYVECDDSCYLSADDVAERNCYSDDEIDYQ